MGIIVEWPQMQGGLEIVAQYMPVVGRFPVECY